MSGDEVFPLRGTFEPGRAPGTAPEGVPGMSDPPSPREAPCSSCGSIGSPLDRCEACGRVPDDPRIGRVVAGRYTIEAAIGDGGMGRVYRAQHLGLGEPVAVKFLLGGEGVRPELRARFRREAVVLARLRHPNIVSVIDYGEDHGEPFLVMELLHGTLLHTLVRAGGLTLPFDRVVTILDQVLQVLETVHAAGVVHRDLKPENVMVLHAPGPIDRVKVIDFGIALLDEGSARLTAKHEVRGTAHFMSPEQCLGRDVGAPTDVYAVGVMLYELLVGEPPFAGRHAEIITQQLFVAPPSFAERPPPREVPPGVEALLARALAKRADDRPTAAQFRDALLLAARSADPAARAARAADERARTALLPRDERALAPRTVVAERAAADDLPVPVVAICEFSHDRAAALRFALAAHHVAAYPVAGRALPDRRAWQLALVPAGPDAAARTAALRAAHPALPVVVLDLALPAEAPALIRAGASDCALAALDDAAVCRKVMRALRRGR